MRQFLLLTVVACVCLILGFAGGWFAHPLPRVVGLQMVVQPNPPTLADDPPKIEEFAYPGAEPGGGGASGGGQYGELRFGGGEYDIRTTADPLEQVFAFYREKFELGGGFGSASSSSGGSLSTFDGVPISVIGRHTSELVFKVPGGGGPGYGFKKETLQYSAFGLVLRPAGAEKTTAVLFYRPNREMQSLLKAGMKR